MTDLEMYFKKHNICAADIMYIYRSEKRTVIHCKDGREETSLIPVHELREFLPQDDFIGIVKGVIVRRNQIVHISNDGIYTMIDGKTFQGRQRNLSFHRKLRREMGFDLSSASDSPAQKMSFLEKCSVLDDMPLAYCVIELVFDENGHGIDFLFRYCNHQMEIVEGIPISEMLNHSFYEIFKNGDKKWLVSYADVALNGTSRTVCDFSPEIGKTLTIHCYQPEPGFCSCVLIPNDSANNVDK